MYKIRLTEDGLLGFLTGINEIGFGVFGTKLKIDYLKQTFYLPDAKFFYIGFDPLMNDYSYIIYNLKG
jgi:hypothetical protein